MPKLYLRDRLYIPCSAVKESVLRKHYRKVVYQESACTRCPHVHERPCEFCENCQAYKGLFKTYGETEIKGKHYWAIPRAEFYCLDKLGLDVADFLLVDQTSQGTKLDPRLKLTKPLYPYQLQCQQDLIEGPKTTIPHYVPHGILKAPPRSGKCVVGESWVVTDKGFQQIRDLFEPSHLDGEIREARLSILSHDQIRPVVALYKKTVDQTIRLTTGLGFQLQGTPDHPVLSNGQWVPLNRIQIGQSIALQRTNYWPSAHAESAYWPVIHGLADVYRQSLLSDSPVWQKTGVDPVITKQIDRGKGLPSCILRGNRQVQWIFLHRVFSSDLTELKSDDISTLAEIQLLLLNFGILSRLDRLEGKLTLLDKAAPDMMDHVASIEIVHDEVTVYDVSVPHAHCFIANGIVSHNTLTALSIAFELGGKFLILANQEDLLKQFIIELRQSTNVEKTKSQYKLCKTLRDFQTNDICLATYQTFLSKDGKLKLEQVKDLFNTIVVDECHRVAAKQFSKVLSAFSARNRFGLTATDKRKDGLDFVTEQILGPVRAIAKVETLVPKVYVIETHIRSGYEYRSWNGAMQFLARSQKRQALILNYVKRDLENGHKIVIPVMYKKQAFELVQAIREMGYTSEAFVAGVKREDLLIKARKGEIDVVVGIRSIVSTGINVPVWSCLAGSTWIPTSHGHLRMSDLRIDHCGLQFHNGESLAFINFCGLRKKEKTLLIETEYGTHISCSYDHVFAAIGPDYSSKDISAEDLLKNSERQEPIDWRLLGRACTGLDSGPSIGGDAYFGNLTTHQIAKLSRNELMAFLSGTLDRRAWRHKVKTLLVQQVSFTGQDDLDLERLELIQLMILHFIGVPGMLDRKKLTLTYSDYRFSTLMRALRYIKSPWLKLVRQHMARTARKNRRWFKSQRRVWNGYYAVRIKSIKKGPVQDLYDVSMKDQAYPYYVAGSVINHNCQYTIAPISNPPNYYQETLRVCTPMEGKKPPIIRLFVDDMGMTRGCFRTCWFQTVVKYGFKVNEKHTEIAKKIIKRLNPKSVSDEEMQVYRDPDKTVKMAKPKGKQWRPLNLFGREK